MTQDTAVQPTAPAMTTRYPIPSALNLLVLCLALPASLALLWAGSHVPWGWALLAAVAFALVNNTLFALIHEAIHGLLVPHRKLNELLGMLCAATFPAPFVAYRYGHLQHHRRNRTDIELFDYYLPHETRWKRNLWLYLGNLGGGYWALLPLGTVVYLLAPWFCRSAKLKESTSDFGIGAGVGDIAELPLLKSWLQCLFVVAWQAAVFHLLDLSWQRWLLCYWVFGLHWSALQYADHVWSPRDVLRGAWNLKVIAPVRWLALNYHYHLAHHLHPGVPWLYLGRFVPANEVQPSFLRNYLRLWGGVRPAPPMRGAKSEII